MVFRVFAIQFSGGKKEKRRTEIGWSIDSSIQPTKVY